MVYKIISETRDAKYIQLLTSALIFVSASPLFEIYAKLAAAASIIAIIYIYSYNKIEIKIVNLLIIGVLLYFITIYGFVLDLVFMGEVSYQGLGFALFVLLGFLLAQRVTRDDFFSANESLVKLSLAIGLPIHLLLQIKPALVQYGFNYSYGNFEHITFIFLNVLMVDGYPIQRFTGFGSEPGLTQIFYLLALFSRLSRNGGRLDLFLLIILLAVVLSKSTFGIFVCVLLLVNLVSLKNLLKYLIILLPIMYFVLFDKLAFHFSEKFVGSDSFAVRYDRYIYFFGGDLLNVIFGNGNSYYLSLIAPFDLGGWDSFLQVSQRYGLIFTIALFFLLYSSNRARQKPVFLVIFLAFFTQSIWFLPVIAYFYFKGCHDCSSYSLR